MSSLDYLDLCRLCLVKDGVSVPIFEGEGDVRQIFLKIAACLPVKVAREDKLPKKICDNCVYKVELLYQFWNTTANAEKQLLQWLGEVGLEDKQGYVTGVLNTSTMKEEDDASSVIQSSIATTTPQSGIGIGVIDNIGLGMPFSGTTHQQQLPPTIPINQPIHQALPGPSNQPAPDQLSQTQGNATTRPQDEEEESSEEEDNSDDDCDADDGLPVKEESEEDLGNSRNIEPTTFVNVSLACDEAGPSGLQQQKNTTEIPELSMPQTLNESDAKSGLFYPAGFGGIRNGYGKSTLRTARRVRSSGPFKCIVCSCGFKTTASFKQHVSKVHDASLPEQFKCHHCEFETNWKGNLCGHMRLHAAEIAGAMNKRPCKFCDRSFTEQKDLLNHINTHKPLRYSMDASDSLLYECDFCGMKIKEKMDLLQHRQLHVDRLRMDCPICHKWFRYRDKLELHVKEMHKKDRPFSCLICERSYKTKTTLQKHTKVHKKQTVCFICGIPQKSQLALDVHLSKHEMEYNMFCTKCNEGFFTVNKLNAHMMLEHEGKAEPFECKICGDRLASRTYLELHSKSHVPPVRYNCSMCNFQSTWKTSLRVHMRIHSGENLMTCEVCGKCLSTKTSFDIHMRIHTGEKPHICEICGKAFSAKKYLHIHNRTHTGEKPYPCEKCSKRFTQKGSMKLHMKSQHAESSV
ncbi:zinc finger protein ZFP2-like isoform X5 [Athalia rosae]|uniref:zinc finger protein ZFP2-like isoform X5 n=1 Tax=Athalia rosae TaxID=37344 RepID=UPI0020349A9D|nr:zinc finger protein ZFP2-like isoform X5 [Athalia rosae]